MEVEKDNSKDVNVSLSISICIYYPFEAIFTWFRDHKRRGNESSANGDPIVMIATKLLNQINLIINEILHSNFNLFYLFKAILI